MSASVYVGCIAVFATVEDSHRYPRGEWAIFGETQDGCHAIQLDDAEHGTILVEWPDHEAGKARSYWQGMMDAPIAQR